MSEDFGEGFFAGSSDFGKDFSIEGDVVFLERSDELAVSGAILAEGGIEADIPKPTEVSLLVSPVSEGVGTCVENSFPSLLLFGASTEAVAFDHLQGILPRF